MIKVFKNKEQKLNQIILLNYNISINIKIFLKFIKIFKINLFYYNFYFFNFINLVINYFYLKFFYLIIEKAKKNFTKFYIVKQLLWNKIYYKKIFKFKIFLISKINKLNLYKNIKLNLFSYKFNIQYIFILKNLFKKYLNINKVIVKFKKISLFFIFLKKFILINRIFYFYKFFLKKFFFFKNFLISKNLIYKFIDFIKKNFLNFKFNLSSIFKINYLYFFDIYIFNISKQFNKLKKKKIFYMKIKLLNLIKKYYYILNLNQSFYYIIFDLLNNDEFIFENFVSINKKQLKLDDYFKFLKLNS